MLTQERVLPPFTPIKTLLQDPILNPRGHETTHPNPELTDYKGCLGFRVQGLGCWGWDHKDLLSRALLFCGGRFSGGEEIRGKAPEARNINSKTTRLADKSRVDPLLHLYALGP